MSNPRLRSQRARADYLAQRIRDVTRLSGDTIIVARTARISACEGAGATKKDSVPDWVSSVIGLGGDTTQDWILSSHQEGQCSRLG